MKKSGIFNADIAAVVASMGHGDMISVVDLGFPIPLGMKRIDLVVSHGDPGFLEVVDMLMTELKVEKVILAQETRENSAHIFIKLKELLSHSDQVEFVWVTHKTLKELACQSKAVIRTGEVTPYANAIFVSGVIF